MKFYIKTKCIGKDEFYKDFEGNSTELLFGTDDFANMPISLFVDYVPTPDELKINPYNILMIMEPNEYFGLHTFAKNNYTHFSCILT